MKATIRTIKLQFLFFFSLSVFHFSSAQQSTFDQNDEGWRVSGDVQNFTEIPEYDSTGGNPGGYCYAVDVSTGQYWYWVAPDTFMGDKSASFAKYLRFDLRQSDITSQGANRADVILEGNGIKLFYNTPNNPSTMWTHYDILLDTAGWERNSFGSGQVVTKDDFQQVLDSVTKLWIRGEYRLGPDIGSIDNVILEPVISSSVPSISTAIQSMDVYPNPAGDFFTLSLKGEPRNAVLVDIFNSTGQVLFSETLDFLSGAILKVYPCRDYPAGIYWIRVSDFQKHVFRKVIIE